jgi:carbon starvation protein
MFGASNQLVAGLALIVVSAYLKKKQKNYKITLLPALILFLITLSSLILKVKEFFLKNNFLLLVISLILIFLGIFIIWEAKRNE